MARLQLAENYMSLSEGVADLYITIPDGKGGVMKVREDVFDDLDDDDYNAIMELVEPLNTPTHMNGLFSKWRANRAVKRDERRSYKLQKQQDKFAGREAVAKAGGGVGGVMGKITDVIGGIFGGKTDSMPAPDQRDLSLQIGQDLNPPQMGTWWQRNKTWAVPVGIGVAVVGSALLLKKRKKKTTTLSARRRRKRVRR